MRIETAMSKENKKMIYEAEATYHIYNRSNDTLFYNRENYLYFLKNIKKHILPYADILAWCLMPNHFHILLTVNEEGVEISTKNFKEGVQLLSKSIGTMLSSYTQAINKQEKRKGSLFAHTTKAKILNDAKNDYLVQCFMYIHQNPILAGLVDKLEDWEFSSYPDYIGKREGKLINKELALEMLNIDNNDIEFITNKLLVDKTDDDFL